nr:MAG TPA: hypothetical protein [Caudoviricetes sp.]
MAYEVEANSTKQRGVSSVTVRKLVILSVWTKSCQYVIKHILKCELVKSADYSRSLDVL